MVNENGDCEAGKDAEIEIESKIGLSSVDNSLGISDKVITALRHAFYMFHEETGFDTVTLTRHYETPIVNMGCADEATAKMLLKRSGLDWDKL